MEKKFAAKAQRMHCTPHLSQKKRFKYNKSYISISEFEYPDRQSDYMYER